MTRDRVGPLTDQCLNRRIVDIEIVRKEADAWQQHRNNKTAKVNWQFTNDNARIKLLRLYPTLDETLVVFCWTR
jgi:hypothetical protein